MSEQDKKQQMMQKLNWLLFLHLKNRKGVYLYKYRKAILPQDPLPEDIKEPNVPLYKTLNRKERRHESSRTKAQRK